MSGRISTRELPRRFDCEYTDLNIQYTNNMYNMFQYAISNLKLYFFHCQPLFVLPAR